jgi:hypothetical protein
MPACLGVPGTMILDEVPPDAFFASSSSFLFFAVLNDVSIPGRAARQKEHALLALARHLRLELGAFRELAVGLAAVAALVEVLLPDGVEDRAELRWVASSVHCRTCTTKECLPSQYASTEVTCVMYSFEVRMSSWYTTYVGVSVRAH